MTGLLITRDGYTLKGQARPHGPWPAVKFTYRPALPERVEEFLDAAKGGKATSDAQVKLLNEHLLSWDVTDAKEQPVPITPATLAQVPHPVRRVLVDHVTGWSYDAWEDDAKNSV